MNLEEEFVELVSRYFPWVPEAYWPLVTLVLASVFVVAAVIERLTAIGNVLALPFRWLFKKKPVTTIVDPPPARVLRAVWLRDKPPRPTIPRNAHLGGIPILSFINMKGGVGKTTMSANVGAHFQALGARVLFIDFDYQGTLSLMVASAAGSDRVEANSYRLLEDTSYSVAAQYVHQFPGLERVGLFASHYVLFRDEMQLFANWVSGKTSYDIRYALAKILSDEQLAKDWDIVIIDCGPRFTTSTINALCASTHVVIPAILDEPSSQAVGYLSREFQDHKAELFPALKLLGVIPTMINQDPVDRKTPKFSDTETEQIGAIKRAVSITWSERNLVLENARIPDRAPISKHANKIAYYENSEAKRVFARAGDILLERLKNEGFRTSW